VGGGEIPDATTEPSVGGATAAVEGEKEVAKVEVGADDTA